MAVNLMSRKALTLIALLWTCEGKRKQASFGDLIEDAKDTSQRSISLFADAYRNTAWQREEPTTDEEPGQVKLEDSNIANIGSDEDKAARKDAAGQEEAFKGVGQAPGLWVWRIETFQLVPWKKTDYGKFYKGDCYLVLKTTKDDEEETLNHHVYFWLGSKSTLDEQGAAAYKAVQLDDLFDGAPVQSREVEGSESTGFIKLFKHLQYIEGGVQSGFDPKDPTAYKVKLFLVRKTQKDGLRILEVPASASSLNQGDCFLLDGGLTIITWCGNKASPMERFRAGAFGRNTESERLRAQATMEDGEPSEKFWELLGGKGEIKETFEKDLLKATPYGEGVLYKLTHEGEGVGKLKLAEVARGDLNKDMLDSNDIMLVDTTAELFVWIGKGADVVERRNAMDTAIQYIKDNNMPMATPVHVFKEGQKITHGHWMKIFSD